MNEVVKYENQLNKVALRKFTANELDLFISICSKIKEKTTDTILFNFSDLKNIIKLDKNYTNEEFKNELLSVNRKLLELNFQYQDSRKIVQFALFQKFVIDLDNLTLEILVNKEFDFLLNTLTSNFTRFELEEFVNFKSSYTKEFFRRMKQFRNTGFWDVDIVEFRRVLDIPKSYKITDVDKRVLKPIKEELKEYNLKVEKKYKSSGARPKVIGFIFKFNKEKKNNIYNTALDLNIEQYEGITFQYINTKYPEESGMATIKYIKYDNNKYIFNYDVNNCYGTLKLSKSEFERLLNSREYHAN